MTETADKFWSVTTIIGNGIPKPALVPWAAKTTATAAVDNIEGIAALAKTDRDGAIKFLTDARFKKSGDAAARGTEVHEIAESYALGTPKPASPEIQPYVDQYLKFLEDHAPEYLASEAPVYNFGYTYAGTLDAIVKIGGKTCVLDIKTTDKGPDVRARPPYPEVALQLAAYARADVIGLQAERVTGSGGRRYYIWEDGMECDPVPEIDGAFALVISPHDYRLIPVRIDDTVWNTFLYAREIAKWMLETSKTALGPPVTGGK